MITVVCGVIYNSSNEVLLAQRKWPIDGVNYWEFPGGKTDPGESLFDALKREWIEEFELTITPIKHLKTVESPPYCLEFIEGTAIDNPKALNNHLQYRWVNLDDYESFASSSGITLLRGNEVFLGWYKSQR